MLQPEQNKNYQTEKSQVISLEKGKIPPQAIDLEEVVLGACLMDSMAFTEALETLNTQIDVFYKEQHKYIFTAMLELYADSEKIDLLTVSQKLKSKSHLDLVGGDFYLISLTQRVSSSAHIEYHCRLLMQFYVKRESIKVASKIIEDSYDETTDIFDLLEVSHRSLDETSQWLNRKKPDNIKEIYNQVISKKTASQGSIPSKFTKINKRTNGYHGSDLHIIAARPGMGKTAFVINEAKHQADNNIPVGFLSLEMSSAQLVGRIIAIEFGIEASRIKFDQLTDSERSVLKKESKKIENLPLYILDQPSLSIMAARITIGKWVRQNKVRIVYVDYLQLMTSGGQNKNGNREQEISYISRSLKGIAKEFDIPIVALSQLSRSVETRGGSKRPMLSDLRESGAIEQDADVVQFIYRPEYYDIEEWDDDEKTPTHGQTEIITEKSREAELGHTRIANNLKYMKFMDLEDNNQQWNGNEFKPQPVNPNEAFEPNNRISDQDKDDLPF